MTMLQTFEQWQEGQRGRGVVGKRKGAGDEVR